MRYKSIEESQNDHRNNYRSDGIEKGKGTPSSPDFYRVNFVVMHCTDSSRVLDVGCNGGTIAVRLISERRCRVNAIDIVPELVEKAKKRGVFAKVGTAETIDYPDNTFDHVVCSEVLEHLFDPEKAIKEAFRVLKDSGSYIITVPSDDSDEMSGEKLGDFHHQNFTKESILEIVKKYFDENKITVYGIGYSNTYCKLTGISPEKVQWIGIEAKK